MNDIEQKTFTVAIPVDGQTLADIIITAVEGGIGYWCPDYELGEIVTGREPGEVWNAYAARNLVEGGTMVFREQYSDHSEEHTLTVAKLLTGLGRALADHRHFQLDNMDATDADVVIQYALLEEIRYG